MIEKRKLVRGIYLTAGLTELLLGIVHFAFPTYVLKSGGFLNLNIHETDFITASIFGLGLNLVAWGTIIIIAGIKYELFQRILLYLSLIQVLKYTGRLWQEYVYPVKVNLPVLKNSQYSVAFCLFALWALYSVSFVITFKSRDKV